MKPGNWRERRVEVDQPFLLRAQHEGTNDPPIDPKLDSLCYYHLGSNRQRKVGSVGSKPAPDLNGLLLI